MSDAHGDRDAARPAAWRRWLGIGLRTAHLASVTLLGAALLGAPLSLFGTAAAGAASGAALLAVECADGRIRLLELAGMVALAKLALVAWMALAPPHASALYWVVLVVSGVSSHAPRTLRHWRPRSRRSRRGRPPG